MRMAWSPRMKILMPLTRRKAAKAKVLKVKTAPKLKPTKAPTKAKRTKNARCHPMTATATKNERL
jgi:hypothetical protein